MKNRFEKIYKQGTLSIVELWVDTETGVNYMFVKDGYGGGLSPLLRSEEHTSELQSQR